MLSVTGAGGNKITVSFDDAGAAHVQSDIAEIIQDSIDTLDEEIKEVLSPSMTPDESEADPSPVVVNVGKKIPLDDVNIDESSQETAGTIKIMDRSQKTIRPLMKRSNQSIELSEDALNFIGHMIMDFTTVDSLE